MAGVYVPALVPQQRNAFGQWVPARPATGSYASTAGVKRLYVQELRPENYPVANLVPNQQPVHPRFSVEIMRGCTQGCRFCQAGYWYRPTRELAPDAAISIARQGIEATGERELGLLSLSTAD